MSPRYRQPTPHLQLEMERFKRQRRNGNNNVDFGQKEGQGWGYVFFEDPAQKSRSSDKWEVKGRAARSNRIAEVGRWAESKDLASIHTIPSAPFSTPSKSSSFGGLPVLAERCRWSFPLWELTGGCENKTRCGSLANVCDPGHCATLPLQESRGAHSLEN